MSHCDIRLHRATKECLADQRAMPGVGRQRQRLRAISGAPKASRLDLCGAGKIRHDPAERHGFAGSHPLPFCGDERRLWMASHLARTGRARRSGGQGTREEVDAGQRLAGARQEEVQGDDGQWTRPARVAHDLPPIFRTTDSWKILI